VLEKMSRQRTSRHWLRIKKELTSPYSQQNDVAKGKHQDTIGSSLERTHNKDKDKLFLCLHHLSYY